MGTPFQFSNVTFFVRRGWHNFPERVKTFYRILLPHSPVEFAYLYIPLQVFSENTMSTSILYCVHKEKYKIDKSVVVY